ncbi:hypothetical protein ACJ41O_013496 [Fusarium nematophilum]
MAGRRRRASTSSVETVDDNRIQWRQETSVLKTATKPSAETIFELRDAVVLNKDGKTLENALYVGTRGPFVVHGTLIIDEPSQRQHLIMKVRQSVPIEVRKCIKYSIGETEDSQPIIWVEGRGAWYEINPSPAYLPIYNKMCEAAILYYRIMDIYKAQKSKKSKKGKPNTMNELHRVFHLYAARIGDGSTLEEVIERCEEHALFLISQCMQEEEAIFDWTNNPFYKWLTTRHHEQFEKAQEIHRNPPKPRSSSIEIVAPPAPAPAPVPQVLPSRTRSGSSVPTTARSIATPEVIELEDSPPRQRSTRSRSATHKDADSSVHLSSRFHSQRPAHATQRPPSVYSAASSPSIAPTIDEIPGATNNEEDMTPFQTVLNGIEFVYDAIGKSKHGMTMLSTLNKLYFGYKFPNFKKAGVIGCHKIPVEELLHYNAEALLQVLDKVKYGHHEFYAWLHEAAKRPFQPEAIKLSDFPYRLIPRGSRPRPSKATEPTSMGQVEVPTSSLDDDISSTARSSPAGKSLRRPGRPSGKKSGLRLATGSKKRPHSDVDSDSDDEESGPKRSHYFSDGDETMEDEEAQTSSPELEAPRETSQEPIKVVIRADKIPSTVPHGPNETWVCEEEDCGYVVRGGDAEECQDRIKRHFKEHESQVERVNLAMTESTRGHLPINHLIEKLKSMGEKSQANQQLSVDGVLLPQRIKRNLLV